MVRRLNKYWKQAAREESGFTLVEQIVTVVIVGLVLTAAMAALATGALGLNVVTSRNEAMNLAQAQMECIKNQDFNTGVSPYGACSATIPPSGYSLNLFVEPFEPEVTTRVQRIKVTVQRGSNEILVLEDLKVKRGD